MKQLIILFFSKEQGIFSKLSHESRFKYQKYSLMLLLLTLIQGGMEISSIGTIMPVVAIFLDPNGFVKYEFVKRTLEFFPQVGSENLMELFILLSIFAFISASLLRLVTQYFTLFFICNLERELSRNIFKKTLQQNYEYFSKNHQKNFEVEILVEISQYCSGLIYPLILLISNSIICFLVISFLASLSPIVTLAVMAVLMFSYFTIAFLVNNFLIVKGEQRLETNKKRFSIVKNSMSSILQTKIYGLEKHFSKEFSTITKGFANAQINGQFIAFVPRSLIEIIAFITIILFLGLSENITEPQPLFLAGIAGFLYAGMRLLPLVQNIYHSYANAKYNIATAENLKRRINTLNDIEEARALQLNEKSFTSLEIKKVSYYYPDGRLGVKNVSLNISPGDYVCIVGSSGSGKSTFCNLMFGLIQPHSGLIKLNEIQEPAFFSAWMIEQATYVPQKVYIFDKTILENITLKDGTVVEDQDWLQECLKICELNDLINSQLSDGLMTKCGEDGSLLSGGQRQRIGIARALYQKPSIIILDEATSGIDQIMEQRIIEGIRSISSKITIVNITHRINSTSKCKKIVVLENGKIVTRGSFSKLMENSALFRSMGKI